MAARNKTCIANKSSATRTETERASLRAIIETARNVVKNTLVQVLDDKLTINKETLKIINNAFTKVSEEIKNVAKKVIEAAKARNIASESEKIKKAEQKMKKKMDVVDRAIKKLKLEEELKDTQIEAISEIEEEEEGRAKEIKIAMYLLNVEEEENERKDKIYEVTSYLIKAVEELLEIIRKTK